MEEQVSVDHAQGAIAAAGVNRRQQSQLRHRRDALRKAVASGARGAGDESIAAASRQLWCRRFRRVPGRRGGECCALRERSPLGGPSLPGRG
jgi:hypothetical protein